MLYAMYCQNRHRLAFIDPETGGLNDSLTHNLFPPRGMFEEPAKVPTFCAECGTKGMSQCPSCKEFIAYDDSKVHHVPNYCTQYGQAFPWTITTLQLANEYTDELDLSAEDKLTLKNSILDLTRDTPKTEIAIGRFKRVYAKVAPAAGTVLRGTIQAILTDYAKHKLGF